MAALLFLFPIAVFLFLLLINLKCLSGILLYQKLKKQQNLTEGIITDFDKDRLGYAIPIITFTDKNGAPICGVAQNLKSVKRGDFLNNWEIGQSVEIYYDENDPTFFITRSVSDFILILIIFGITGFIILSIVLYFLSPLF